MNFFRIWQHCFSSLIANVFNVNGTYISVLYLFNSDDCLILILKEMTNRKEKTQCVSWFIATKSISQTQLNYKSIYGKDPPSEALILKWHKTFVEAGTFADNDESKLANENDAICTDIKQEIITEDECFGDDQDESVDSKPSSVNAETSTRIKIEEPSDDEDVNNDLEGQSSYTQDEIHLYPVEMKQEIKMEDNADEYSEETDVNKDDVAEDEEAQLSNAVDIADSIYPENYLKCEIVENNSKDIHLACAECNQTFPDLVNLKIHLTFTHYIKYKYKPFAMNNYDETLNGEISGKKYKCDRCIRSFDLSMDLDRHMIVHAEMKSFFCILCKKPYKFLTSLKRHHIKIHSKDKNLTEKHLQCLECCRAFVTYSGLNKHAKTHVGVKNFSCEICDKTFFTKDDLKSHVRIHSGIKPFSCNVCPRSFITSSSLKSHLRRHSEVKNFHCKICEKSFKTSSDLGTHNLIHSGIKRHICTLCTKSFITSSHLSRHLRYVHSTEKDFSCPICKRTFKTFSKLKTHSSVHSDGPIYRCEICTKTFKTKLNLNRHAKNLHAENKNVVNA